MNSFKCLQVLFILGVYKGTQAVEPGVDSAPAELKLTDDGKFYIDMDREITWEEAKKFCSEHKMKLVSLESKEKEATVLGHILKAKSAKAKKECKLPDKNHCEYKETCETGSFWTSGYETKVQTPRQFEWTGISKPVEGYLNWIPGQPNNWAGIEEKCLELSVSFYFKVGAWNDDVCNDTCGYICEK